jgi:hypothetical protein
MLMRSALFCGIKQRRVVIVYRRFRTTYRSHLKGSRNPRRVSGTSWPLNMGPIRYPETSVNDYHSTLLYTAGQRRSHVMYSLSEESLSVFQLLMLSPWRRFLFVRLYCGCKWVKILAVLLLVYFQFFLTRHRRFHICAPQRDVIRHLYFIFPVSHLQRCSFVNCSYGDFMYVYIYVYMYIRAHKEKHIKCCLFFFKIEFCF